MTDTEARKALADQLLRSKLHTLSHATNFNWNADAQAIIREMLIEAIEATALRSPVTPSPSREEVARIIDPDAFNPQLKPTGGLIASDTWNQRKDIAFYRADCIDAEYAKALALPQARTEPVASVPVCCYCDADLSCASCGREQPASPNPPAAGEVREALLSLKQTTYHQHSAPILPVS